MVKLGILKKYFLFILVTFIDIQTPIIREQTT